MYVCVCIYVIYFQVLWLGTPECNATWEPSTSIPQNLIDHYEAGLTADVTVNEIVQYGHTSGTINVTYTNDEKPATPKRAKCERPSFESLER